MDNMLSDTCSVLVIEDDEQTSFLLKLLLQNEGLIVETIDNGHDAIKYIKSNDVATLVILDIMMPMVDGYKVIKVIRTNSVWRDVPVIMLTGKSQENDIVKALDAGANDYIVKPFQPQELLARARRLYKAA